MEDVTGYLFLHGHILNQQSPDTIGNSMRAFPGFPPWTKSWSARSKTSQTDSSGVYCVLLCCCHPLGHQRKHWNFLPPIYDQSPFGRLMSPGTPPLITHKAEPLPAPPETGSSHPLPEFPGIGLLSSSEECDRYLRLTPFPAICFGNHCYVLILTHNTNKHGFSMEDQ